MIGTGYFGKVDQVGDRCCVETLFFIVVVPLIPLRSDAVVNSKLLVSPAFVAELAAGVSFGSGESRTAVRVPLSLKSILITYVRAVLWVVHGVGTAGWLIFCVLGALLEPQITVGSVLSHLLFSLPFALPGAVGGWLLWLSYRLTRATPERAAELLALLGLPPDDVPRPAGVARFDKPRPRFRRGDDRP